MFALQRIQHLCRAGVGAVVFVSLVVALTGVAGAATCGSNWCSGSDGNANNRSTNWQGNWPQVYVGEVDTACDDFGGCSYHPDWNNTAAWDAWYRYASEGTGIGTQAYYFASGPNNKYSQSGLSDYCWGAVQGYDAAWRMANTYKDYTPWQKLMFIDIEDPITDYGWSPSTQSRDRQVFNGFVDYTAGKQPCGQGNNGQDLSQYGVYSSPDAWCGNFPCGSGGAMGGDSQYGYIPNTYVWTYEKGCDNYWPGATWGGLGEFFGGSSSNWALQFWQPSTGCPATWDADDAYEPDYLPVLGETLGS